MYVLVFPHAKSTWFHSLKRVHFHQYWHYIQNHDPSKFEKKNIIFLTDLQNAEVNHKFLWRSLDWNYILKLYYSPYSSRYHTWFYTIDNHVYPELFSAALTSHGQRNGLVPKFQHLLFSMTSLLISFLYLRLMFQ